MISIERTHEFAGRYHVLGGALSPIDGIDPEDLKIAELFARVDGIEGEDAVREVVLASSPTTTGGGDRPTTSPRACASRRPS